MEAEERVANVRMEELLLKQALQVSTIVIVQQDIMDLTALQIARVVHLWD